MTSLSIFEFNSNNIRFEKRNGRVWVCLTDMAKASGKRFPDWNRLQSTSEFLTEFESVVGFCTTETVQGGIPEKQGTWAIEEVAIEFAGWCSVQFKIWMIQQIKTLMTQGYVALSQSEQPKLPSRVIALETAKAVSEINLLIADDNPRLAQFLIDHAISDIMPSHQNQLTGTPLRGVVEIAEEMGLKVDFHNRSRLGRFVKSQCKNLAQHETRLVNGTMRDVACYPDCDEVRQAISTFFTK